LGLADKFLHWKTVPSYYVVLRAEYLMMVLSKIEKLLRRDHFLYRHFRNELIFLSSNNEIVSSALVNLPAPFYSAWRRVLVVDSFRFHRVHPTQNLAWALSFSVHANHHEHRTFRNFHKRNPLKSYLACHQNTLLTLQRSKTWNVLVLLEYTYVLYTKGSWTVAELRADDTHSDNPLND